ncbi:hypothetical protein ACMD2_02421 [Ananas comosus]|uniref:Uncharacterized protein n=1 Tax=Ananas comosus TaxID=4615 RepID=A0A199UWF5_ANACO|nr:hypothetical protein ACMD2_02421 [Ananas comosus]
MGSRVVTPEEVLESLMNDGTIDAIRMKIIAQLKANEDMKKNTMMMVEQSKVLNTPGAEKKTKRELFDELRRELETSVLEKASKAVWELILDSSGLGKEITETVEKVYCRLSGQEPPPPPALLPLPTTYPQEENEKESKDKQAGEKAKEMDISEPSSRKRTFSEMNALEKAEAVENGSPDRTVASEDGTLPSTNAKT